MREDMRREISIVMADDDLDDQLMIQKAFERNHLTNKIFFVGDGEELLDFIMHRNKYADVDLYPTPGLILLDLNMPKMSGREALKIIRQNPVSCKIPVVVLTTSKEIRDIDALYELGANSFINKPVTFEGLVEIVQTIGSYWFSIVELPSS